MKVVVLNASPRKNGLVSQMLNIIIEHLPKECEVSLVTTNSLSLRPCIGCMKCRTTLNCCLPEDDAQRILKEIKEANALVVGSPCYWGNMNGYLKVLFDRIVYGMMGESPSGIPIPLHKGKQAIIVTTCTTPFPFNILFKQSRGAVKALRIQNRRNHRERRHPKASRTNGKREEKVHTVGGKTQEKLRLPSRFSHYLVYKDEATSSVARKGIALAFSLIIGNRVHPENLHYGKEEAIVSNSA